VTAQDGELVGREEQIAAILAEARQVSQGGRSAAVFLDGEDGLGKSALAGQAARRIREKLGSFSSIVCACRPGPRDPYAPVESMVSEVLRIPAFARERSREVLEQRVAQQLEGLRLFSGREELEEHSRVLTELLAHEAGRPEDEGAKEAPVDRKLRTLEKVLAALTETRHLALVFDDIHNGTPEGRFLLANLHEALVGRPILWMFTRGSGDDELLPSVHGVHVTLEPLDEDEVRRVLEDIFPDLTDFSDELFRILARTSGGYPGTLHHLVGLLIEERVLEVGKDGRWSFNPDRLHAEDLPLDREAVLHVRFEQLDENQRQALEMASVVGSVFWEDLVMAMIRSESRPPDTDNPAQIWPDDRDNLTIHGLLEELESKGFISEMKTTAFPGVAEYVFMNDAFQQRLAGRMDEKLRAARHRFAARWMEMEAGDRSEEFSEVIALHWERGSRRGEASAFYMQAADMARRRYLFDRSIDLYQRALDQMPEHAAQDHMEALHDLGTVFQMQGETDEALDCFTGMLSIAWQYVHRSKAAAALSKIGRVYRTLGDYAAARAYLERALALFKQAADQRGIASTQDDLGNIHYLQGSYDQAAQLYLDAINMREEMDDTRGLALSYEHLGQVDRAQGNLAEAEKRFNEVLRMRREVGDEEGTCSALNALGVVAHDRGGKEAAVAIWREALEIAVRTGNLRMQEYLYNNLGEVLVSQRRYPQAESYFKHALELSMSLADRRAETEVCRNLGLLYVEMGNRQLGREHLDRSLRIARDIGSREAMGIALRSLGRLEGHAVFDEEGGPAGAADSYFQEAQDIFDAMGNETELLRTMEAYARYLFDHGRAAEAADILDEAAEIASHQGEETYQRIVEEAGRYRRFI
jgi:tetratricopeptide (TPR) repeat protein